MMMTSQQIPEEFKEIRPYAEDEFQEVIDDLLHDEQFCAILPQVVPTMTREELAVGLKSCASSLELQKRFIYPFVQKIIDQHSDGLDLSLDSSVSKQEPHTFITNHRDIVLDSAFLSYLMILNDFETTVEIAIGDNLLIYPWIKKLVRLNKSFIVQRSLSMREFLLASDKMSRYMHFAINAKRENIWIAQREGRAKDSCDTTQSSILKMMAMGGEGSIIERIKDLHLVPTAISYEYDPCDFLKAREFQLKRDDENYKKAPADDLINMQTGIFGFKGHVHIETAACINDWLDTLDASMPKGELFNSIAQHIDEQLHQHYRLYPINYVAADLLQGEMRRASNYTAEEKTKSEAYFEQRMAMVKLSQPDTAFLKERILTMYANPVFNYERAIKA